MKSTILTILLFACSFAFASVNLPAKTRLTNYEELKAALFQGHKVNLVNNYKLCVETNSETGVQKPGADAVGGMQIKVFEKFPKKYSPRKMPFIAVSHSSLMMYRDEVLHDYAKVRFYEDGLIEVKAYFIDPNTNKADMIHDVTCRINDGTNKQGVNIFLE